jgi:hypothetical protein
VGEDIFESNPDKGGQKKNQFGKSALNFRKTPGKKGPKEGKVENKNGIDQKAYLDREIAIVGRNRRNPINQDGIKHDATQKSEQKGLFRRFFIQGEEKGDKGNPTEKGEAELGEGQCCQGSA